MPKEIWNENNALKGIITDDGKILDENRSFIGRIDKDGSVYDQSDNYKGIIDKGGNVYNREGTLVGRIKPDGTTERGQYHYFMGRNNIFDLLNSFYDDRGYYDEDEEENNY